MSDNYPYDKLHKNALICGRFSHIHKGHQKLIDSALYLADRVLVFVGSAQESGTKRNPFPVDLRVELIKKIYPQPNVIVKGLADMTTEDDICPEWGRYLLDHAISELGCIPDLMIYGNDERRSGWFSDEDAEDIDTCAFRRQDLPISATEMREFLRNDDFDSWRKYADPKIWDYYYALRNIVL